TPPSWSRLRYLAVSPYSRPPPPKLSCSAGRLCTLRDRSFERAVPTQYTRWVVRLCKPGRRWRSLTCSAGPPHHGCAVATVLVFSLSLVSVRLGVAARQHRQGS